MSPRGLQISSVCTNFHFFGGLLRWLFIASCKTRHFFNSNYIYNIYIHIIDIYIYTQIHLCCQKTSVPNQRLLCHSQQLNVDASDFVENCSRQLKRQVDASTGAELFSQNGDVRVVEILRSRRICCFCCLYIYIWNFCYIVIYSHPPKKLRLHGVPKLKWDEHFFFGSY